jgi:hypothetical protein
MPKFEIDQMSSEELWALYLEIRERLLKRINKRKDELEERLRELHFTPQGHRSR